MHIAQLVHVRAAARVGIPEGAKDDCLVSTVAEVVESFDKAATGKSLPT